MSNQKGNFKCLSCGDVQERWRGVLYCNKCGGQLEPTWNRREVVNKKPTTKKFFVTMDCEVSSTFEAKDAEAAKAALLKTFEEIDDDSLPLNLTARNWDENNWEVQEIPTSHVYDITIPGSFRVRVVARSAKQALDHSYLSHPSDDISHIVRNSWCETPGNRRIYNIDGEEAE